MFGCFVAFESGNLERSNASCHKESWYSQLSMIFVEYYFPVGEEIFLRVHHLEYHFVAVKLFP